MDEKLYYGRGKDCDNKKLLALIDDVFFSDDEGGRDFLNLLPKIYHDEYRPAYNNFVVQDKTGEMRAAIGAFDIELDVCGEDIKACCIGNVAVGKSYRSKGYMVDLMKMAVDDMHERGIDLALLGGQRQRYGYFGFEAAGVSYKFHFNKQNAKHLYGREESLLRAVKLEENDLEAIEKISGLYTKNVIHAKRPLKDFYRILKSWRHIPYVLYDGDDFAGYFLINEEYNWVCENSVTKPEYYKEMVLAALEVSKKHGISFNAAPFEAEKLRFFNVNSEGLDICGCESILIYNFKKVIGAYLKAKASYARLTDGELTVLIHGQYGDEKLKISIKDNAPSVEVFDGEAEYEFTHHEATRAFFSNFISDRERLSAVIQQWFPLPAFIYSADQM